MSTTSKGSRASFWLGMTVGAILGAAVLFSIYYVPRKGITLSNDPLAFTVVLDEAHGLHPGSPVLVSGVEAGEVTDVRIDNLTVVGWKVLVSLEIFDGERFGPGLTTGSHYEAHRSGLLGEMTVAITPGGEGKPIQPGQLVDGKAPTDMADITRDIGRISKRIADFMDGRQPGDPNLRRALKDFEGFVRNLRAFSEKLPGN